ncbi:MAG: XRE family transcriptional regulator [Rhodospirillaceae bacterium]|nr:XRE family transcriptional regulator [Rhodospirillaceae bacterium]
MAAERHERNNIGRALQRLRKNNDLTLAAVSAKTGVAISTLSKIENNQSSPNFDVLTRLADGLGLDLLALLGESFYTFAHGARTVTRANEGVRYETPLGAYEALSSEIAMKALQPAVVRVPAGRSEPLAMSSHAGEELIYILSGSVRFYMEPYSPTVLEQGDSVHFDSLMPHGFVAAGEEDALMLSISVFDRERTRRMMEDSFAEPANEDDGGGAN